MTESGAVASGRKALGGGGAELLRRNNFVFVPNIGHQTKFDLSYELITCSYDVIMNLETNCVSIVQTKWHYSIKNF